MKFAKGFLAIAAVGALAAGTSAVSQETTTEATKVAPLKQLVPGAYGKVETRYRNEAKLEAGSSTEVIEQRAQWYILPQLGATFFDGKLDTSLLYYFIKGNDETSFDKDLVESYTELTAFSNDYVTISPALYATQTGSNPSFTDQWLYLNVTTAPSTDTAVGKVSLFAGAMPIIMFTSSQGSDKNEIVADEREVGSAALAEDEQKIEQRDPGLGLEAPVLVTLKPNAVAGLGIQTGFVYWRYADPKYKVEEVDGDNRISQDGYEISSGNYNRLKFTYKINDTFSMYNDSRFYTNGFMEAQYSGSYSYQNRTGIQATLF
jgi:hypothetical protein